MVTVMVLSPLLLETTPILSFLKLRFSSIVVSGLFVVLEFTSADLGLQARDEFPVKRDLGRIIERGNRVLDLFLNIFLLDLVEAILQFLIGQFLDTGPAGSRDNENILISPLLYFLDEHLHDFFIGSIDVTPFATPHDAGGSVGYTFTLYGAKLAIATDIGSVRESWMKHVRGADAVLLESNYDPDMLKAGPYPYELKQRILSKRGHLSNDDAGLAAVDLIRNGTKQLFLSHLSKENNFPELAMRTCELTLQMAGIDPIADVSLCVAKRDGNTGMFSISAKLG
jgi:hypothetical protein